jgi:hypothetical protein
MSPRRGCERQRHAAAAPWPASRLAAERAAVHVAAGLLPASLLAPAAAGCAAAAAVEAVAPAWVLMALAGPPSSWPPCRPPHSLVTLQAHTRAAWRRHARLPLQQLRGCVLRWLLDSLQVVAAAAAAAAALVVP